MVVSGMSSFLAGDERSPSESSPVFDRRSRCVPPETDTARARLLRVVRSHRGAQRHPWLLRSIRSKTIGPNPFERNEFRQGHEPLVHTLLTPHDPALAEVADRRKSLPPEIKAEVLRLIRQS
jgi:hypothetical protein